MKLELSRGKGLSRGVQWLLLIALLLGGFGLGIGTFTPTNVQAQNGEGEDSGDEGDSEDKSTAKKESFLVWMIRASGVFGAVLLLLSFIMVALIMMNLLQVTRNNLIPPEFVSQFEERVAARDYRAAFEIAKSDYSFVARVVAAGMSKLNRGYNEAVEGMQEVGEDENMALEHRLSYLALIGTVAPMIGLMGTVWGMIDSFQTIAQSTTQPKPAELADGISTALFTTLEGLTVAIPAMIFYSLLRNRVSRLVLEVGMVGENLLNTLPLPGGNRPQGGNPSGGPPPGGPPPGGPQGGGATPAIVPSAPQQ